MKGESIARVREQQHRAALNRLLEMEAANSLRRHTALMERLAQARRNVAAERYAIAPKEQQASQWWQFWRSRT